MIAAGVQNAGPLGTITGVAPKAFLGNYKVFGSPGVAEYTFRSVWIQALTDAVNDHMDIVTLSLGEGDPAFFGPWTKARTSAAIPSATSARRQSRTPAVSGLW